MSVFKDQGTFMEAGDQTVGHFNEAQFNMYINLIEEEFNVELKDAIAANDRVEILDALLDTLVVTIGAIHSLGADEEGAWAEVVRSNMSKVDAATGKVLKREDGKILKPDTYSPPDLAKFLKQQMTKEYRITTQNIGLAEEDDCALDTLDPIHELKIASMMDGLGSEQRLAEYRAKQADMKAKMKDERWESQYAKDHGIKPGTPAWHALWGTK